MSRFKPSAVHVVLAVFAVLVVGVFVLGGRSIVSDAAVGGSTIPSTLVRPSIPAVSTTAPATTAPATTVAPPTTSAPAPTAPPQTAPPVTQPPAPVVAAVSGACGGNLPPCCVMLRESGGNPTAVNTSSGASGKWQFMPDTWQGYGGYASAAQAPESVQDARAAQIWAGGAGAGHWGGGC